MMKYIKKFNESLNSMAYEEATEWIKQNYSKEEVSKMIDDEIFSGNWIDSDQMQEEGYEDEYDWYTDYGHGEAEEAVMQVIISTLTDSNTLDFDIIGDDTNLYDFLRYEYDINDI